MPARVGFGPGDTPGIDCRDLAKIEDKRSMVFYTCGVNAQPVPA